MSLLQNLNPPGLEMPVLGAIYRCLETAADSVAADGAQALQDRFPAFCRDELVARHAVSANIPKFSSDTTETLRRRVMKEGFWFKDMGSRRQLAEFLTAVVGESRWRKEENVYFILDESLMDVDYLDGVQILIIHIKDLLAAEQSVIEAYCYFVFDPDIEIRIQEESSGE